MYKYLNKGIKMKNLLISLFIIVPALLFSQEKSSGGDQYDIKKEPTLSVLTDLFKVKDVSFLREQRNNNEEYLETEFKVENLTNVSMDLYIFVTATYEKEYIAKSSFESPSLEDTTLIKSIQVYPDDLSNFEYRSKESDGKEKKVYLKYPKNIKAGIDKKTGKPYSLDEEIVFRCRHYSKFQKKYYFFNEITVLIFDSEEKLVYRRSYTVKPIRR